MLGSKFRNAWLQTLLVVGLVTGFGLGRLAYSQTPPEEAIPEALEEPVDEEPAAEEPVAEEPAADKGDGVEEILVTGSSIRRRDLVTPAPVSILDKVDLDAAGMVSIGDILQDMTAQSNAINTQTNNGNTGSTRVSLRGIGTSRTLVLLNGRRHVAGGTGANSSVDFNAIPAAIIRRVEVLKDGASAVYGSDAIGGVINVITRSDFEGTEATVYTSGTKSGGSILDVAVTTGHSSDNGNIVFSAGYNKRNPLWTFERDWATPPKSFYWTGYQFYKNGDRNPLPNADGDFACDPNLAYDQTDPVSGLSSCTSSSGSSRTPQGTIIDRSGATGNQAWQDIVAVSNGSRLYFNDPMVGWRDFRLTGSFNPEDPASSAGDFYDFGPANYRITPQERYNVFSTGNFTFHKNVRGYYEASYMNRTSSQKLAATPLDTRSEEIIVSQDNFYNPFGRDFSDVRRRMLESSNRNFLQDIDTFRFVGGFDGKLPVPIGSDWRWDLAYNFGRTEGTNVNEGRFIKSRVEAALGPSFVDAAGNLQCGTPSNVVAGCVPLNLFGGPGTITQDMLDYIQYTGIARGFTELQSYTAGVTGKLGEIPFGGDIGLAIGVERRQESGASIPDPTTASGDTTGNKREPTAGEFAVNEAYAELQLNLIEDMPGIETLELVGAVRAHDYDNFGGGQTWKIGGRWQIVPDFALRGTRSTAFRAPSIGALFAGTADSFPSASDPCAIQNNPQPNQENDFTFENCVADGWIDNSDPNDPVYLVNNPNVQLRTRVGGNPDLGPETADIWTVGAVFEPKALKGFTLTVDFYHVEVQDTISSLGVDIIFANCYTSENRRNCDLVNRDAQGVITFIKDTALNIGQLKTAGLDVFARYDYKSPVGRFRFTLDTTWLEKFNLRDGEGGLHRGKKTTDLGIFPAIKWNFGAAWAKDNLGAGLNVRFIGSLRQCELECGPEITEFDGEHNITADIYASYALDVGFGETRLTLGINNALDQDPARFAGGATSAANYDFRGRSYYLRLAQTL